MNDFRSEETRQDDEPIAEARSNAPYASRFDDERRDLDADFRDGSVSEILSVGDAFDYSDDDDDALYDEFDDEFDSDDFDDDFDEDFEVLPDDEFNEAIDDEDYPEEEEDGADDADAAEFASDDFDDFNADEDVFDEDSDDDL